MKYDTQQYEKLKEENRKLRTDILDEFGGKCALCGFGDKDVLQFDHVSGGGTADRSKYNGRPKLWLLHVRDSLRSGEMQILCANCNTKKKIQNNEQGDENMRLNLLVMAVLRAEGRFHNIEQKLTSNTNKILDLSKGLAAISMDLDRYRSRKQEPLAESVNISDAEPENLYKLHVTMREMKTKGATYKEIGKTLGVSWQTVSYHMTGSCACKGS